MAQRYCLRQNCPARMSKSRGNWRGCSICRRWHGRSRWQRRANRIFRVADDLRSRFPQSNFRFHRDKPAALRRKLVVYNGRGDSHCELARGLRFDAQVRRGIRRGMGNGFFGAACGNTPILLRITLEWSDTLRANHYLADIAGLLFCAAYLPRSEESDRLADACRDGT